MIGYKIKILYIKNKQLQKVAKNIFNWHIWMNKDMEIWEKVLNKNNQKLSDKYIRNKNKLNFSTKRSIRKIGNLKIKNINNWMMVKNHQKPVYDNWQESNQYTANKYSKMLLEKYQKDSTFIDKEKYKIFVNNKNLHIYKYIYKYIYKLFIQNILALKKIIRFYKNLRNNEQVYIKIIRRYINNIDAKENLRNTYKYLQKFPKILKPTLEIIPELVIKLTKSNLKFQDFVNLENYSIFYDIKENGLGLPGVADA